MNAAAQPEKNSSGHEDALQLKVCGMRQQENIEALLALQPDYLGFIFFPTSARYVGDELLEETLSRIPASTKKVGVFVNETYENILAIAEKYKLEGIQLHGEESPQLCQKLKAAGLTVLKAFPMDDNFDFAELEAYEGTCNYYLFDTKGKEYGGNGLRFNWNMLRHYNGHTPFFLSGGIGLEHAPEIKSLHLPLLRGIDINSRFEISPALKDTTKVQEFFRYMRLK